MIDISTLEKMPLFSEIGREYLEKLAAHAGEETVARNGYLFREGDRAERLHILLEGDVQLTIGERDEQPTIIEILHPGDNFLLAAVLNDGPYLVSAQAICKVRLLTIPSPLLIGLIREEGDFALRMITALSWQFRTMVRQVKDLRLRNTAQRLAVYLLELSVDQGNATRFRLPHTKRMLASWLGMTPERLSRSFNTLREQGVEVEGNLVQIATLKRLRNFCGFDERLDLAERNTEGFPENDGTPY